MIRTAPPLLVGLLVMLAACGSAPSALAEDGAEAQTVSLINGDDLGGWHADVPEADDNPDVRPSFIVRDGMVVSMGRPGGHLITDKTYSNYRLVVEYRFADKAGNCGVLVHASRPRALYGMFPQSIEVQMQSGSAGDFWCIQENIVVPNMAERRNGPPESWGGGPDQNRHIRNLTDGSENAVGQWNRMQIEVLDDRVRVWVNGDLVNDGFDATATEGHIALQAEGVEVEFRKVELTPIEELTPAEDLPAAEEGADANAERHARWLDQQRRLRMQRTRLHHVLRGSARD